MKNILTVTGSRSEYDLLYPLIKKIDNEKKFEFNLLCCGSHLDKNFGTTIKEIKKDNFKKIYKLKTIQKKNNSLIEILDSHSLLQKKISKLIINKRIKLLIILGDRFEAHASALSAYFLNIPIVHISGGDTSLGSMDEYFRNSISLMSNIHFVKTKKHKSKLIRLGIEKNKIFITGSLSNENFVSEFEKKFIFKKPFGLVTFHPVTNTTNKNDNNIKNLLKAVDSFENLNFLFTASNHDKGGIIINKDIKRFVKNNKKYKFVYNLGRKLYYQAMKNCEFMIGNSSSGILESMIYKKPAINILPRQMGRQSNKNVIHCKNQTFLIKQAIDKALTLEFKKKCKSLKNIFRSNVKSPSEFMLNKIKIFYG